MSFDAAEPSKVEPVSLALPVPWSRRKISLEQYRTFSDFWLIFLSFNNLRHPAIQGGHTLQTASILFGRNLEVAKGFQEKKEETPVEYSHVLSTSLLSKTVSCTCENFLSLVSVWDNHSDNMSERPAQEYLSLSCFTDETTEGTKVVWPGRKQAGWGRNRNADLR